MNQEEIVALVHLTAQCGQWKNALELVNSRFDSRIENLRLHRALIQEASISVKLPDTPKAEKELVEKYLGDHLIRGDALKWVDIDVAGAAIERAGKIIDALEFYERIWQKRVDATEPQRQFARERWVKSKLRQAEYNRYSKRNSDGDDQEKEARRRAHSWNVKIDDLPEYPKIQLSDLDEATPEQESSSSVHEDTLDMIRTYTERGWSAERIANALSLPLEVVKRAQGV